MRRRHTIIIEEPKKSEHLMKVDLVTTRNSFRMLGTIANIERIYLFLTDSRCGLKEFCEYLKDKYPDAVCINGSKKSYNFNTDDIMRELWNDDRFIPALEAGGFDDFSRLQYWASKSKYSKS